MKLPNWFKIIWWAALTLTLGYFLRARLPALLSGNASPGDLVVFGVWMALLLAPLFTEVSILGVTLKSEIEELKGAISAQFSDMRSEMRTYVGVSNTVSPTIHLSQQAPAPDAELPDLEARVKETVEEIFKKRDSEASSETTTSKIPAEAASQQSFADAGLTVNDDVKMLFAARYNIEVELDRIARQIGLSPRRLPMPSAQIVTALTNSGHLNEVLSKAVLEVQIICNKGIHGAEISRQQISFVRDTAPVLVAMLKRIAFEDSKAMALAEALRSWKPKN